jgi:hypothetical protein
MGSLSFNFMATENLSITQVQFGTANTMVNATVINTGTTDIIIVDATVTGVGVTDASLASDVTVGEGQTVTITMTTNAAWTAGNLYQIELLSKKGNQFAYSDTA